MPDPDYYSESPDFFGPNYARGLNDYLMPPPANPAAPPEWLGNVVRPMAQGLMSLPQRAFQASEAMRQGYGYDVGPVLEAAAIPMGTGAVAGVPMRAGEAVLGAGPIRAYHGSPYDFDRFDMSKIGIGEGAQAYGHGLYFAENPTVAQQYRETLGRGDAISVGGAPIDKWNVDFNDRQALNWIQAAAKDKAVSPIDDAIKRASDWADRMERQGGAEAAKSARVTVDRLNQMKERGVSVANPGKTYEVSINADPEHFLDWDRPLSEQHPNIQEALTTLGQSKGNKHLPRAGSDAAESLATNLGGRDKAAEALRTAGVPGIKYLDQGSRLKPLETAPLEGQVSALEKILANTTQGTPKYDRISSELDARRKELAAAQSGMSRNYVLFRDDIIDILRKYGLAGMLGGGAAAASQDRNRGYAGPLIDMSR